MAKERIPNLEKHGKTYRVHKYVDGKIKRWDTGTSDLALALRFKEAVLTREIRAGKPTTAETLERQALDLRKSAGLSDMELTLELGAKGVSFEESDKYLAIASGDATPISFMLDDFIKGYRGRAARTVEARRNAVASFADWLKQEKVPANAEEVTRRIASRYKEHMIGRGSARDTINKALGGLRLYWRWLVDDGHIKETPNPWDRQSVAKIETGEDDEPEVNAYTDAEIATLFGHQDAAEFRDAMALAALSGLRRGELFALTIADTADGFFRVQKGKTKSARRLVPIHSTLRSIVDRLYEGKERGDLLLADRTEVREQSPSRVIGDAFGKRFGRFRQFALPNSTTTNFHAFRHYFGTKLRLARVDEPTVALLMGHANSNITFGRYGKLRGTKLTAEQVEELREFLTPALEAVKLPDDCCK